MNKPTEIGENEINIELTQQAKKNPKYNLYKDWLRSNGVLWRDIDFPVAFGPGGVIGIAAAKDIPYSSSIIAVSNQVLITTDKILTGELSQFMFENPELFKNSQDAEFNILAVFLLREKLKGKDSFYYPLLSAIDDGVILLHWTEEEIEEFDDPSIELEVKLFRMNINSIWNKLTKAFEKYPELFPLEKMTKKDFIWCQETTMTRCFGWGSMTALIPMAEFMNHSPDGTIHHVINTEYEKSNNNTVPKSYIKRQEEIDLTIFNDEDLRLSEEDRKKFLAPSTSYIDFIRRHSSYLSKETRAMVFKEDYNKQDLKKAMREVNLEALNRDKSRQLWDLAWNESSDEDNEGEEVEEGGEMKIENSSNKVKDEKELDFKKRDGDGRKISGGETKDDIVIAIDDSNGVTKKEDDKHAGNLDWSWFSNSDSRNYFVVATDEYIRYKKGEQIFISYGKRNNKFLLLWYGFCIQNNRYNSLFFRLRLNKASTSITSSPKDILLRDFIEIPDHTIRTKRFKVKASCLCEELLTHLRYQLLNNDKDNDSTNITTAIPTSANHEEVVIKYAISLFIEIKNQFKTSLYQDEEILKDNTLHYRRRFAVVYRLEQKKIVETQLGLLKILLNFMDKIKAGVPFKEACMERVADVDHTNDDFMENRRKISSYLRLFYDNYNAQL